MWLSLIFPFSYILYLSKYFFFTHAYLYQVVSLTSSQKLSSFSFRPLKWIGCFLVLLPRCHPGHILYLSSWNFTLWGIPDFLDHLSCFWFLGSFCFFIKSLKSVMGWILFPKKICWNSKFQYLWMWLDLKIGSLKM